MVKNKKLRIAISTAVIGQLAVVSSSKSSAVNLAELWDKTKKVFGYVDTFLSKGMGYAYAMYFLRDIKDVSVDFCDWLKHKVIKTTFREPKEAEKIFKEETERIHGQEGAKKKSMYFLLRVLHEKNRARMCNRERKGADIILYAGTSGCGKSMMAKALAKAISTAPAFVVTSGDIDTSNKDSIVSQLFGKWRSEVNYDGRYQKTREKNCLIAYIERVKHGVVIIEEYDKMHCKDLDEVLRAFCDGGVAHVCGQKVDASGITFILTSNEDLKSVKNDLKNKNLENKNGGEVKNKVKGTNVCQSSTNEQKNSSEKATTVTSSSSSGSKEKNVETNKSDKDSNSSISSTQQSSTSDIKEDTKKEHTMPASTTENSSSSSDRLSTDTDSEKSEFVDLSRTSVDHDKSYMNRLTIVEFDKLRLKDFEEIVRDYGKSIPQYWKKYANITLDISNIFKPVARKAMSMDEQGRAPRRIIGNLEGELSIRSSELNGKKVKVNYNERKDKFSFKVT